MGEQTITCETGNVFVLGSPRVKDRSHTGEVMALLAKRGTTEESSELQEFVLAEAEKRSMDPKEFLLSDELTPELRKELAERAKVSSGLDDINEIVFPALCATVREINGEDLRRADKRQLGDAVELIEYSDALELFAPAVELLGGSMMSLKKKKGSPSGSSEQLKEEETDTPPIPGISS